MLYKTLKMKYFKAFEVAVVKMTLLALIACVGLSEFVNGCCIPFRITADRNRFELGLRSWVWSFGFHLES